MKIRPPIYLGIMCSAMLGWPAWGAEKDLPEFRELVEKGMPEREFLGLLTKAGAGDLEKKTDREGLEVLKVEKGCSADKAGIQPGDYLIRLEKQHLWHRIDTDYMKEKARELVIGKPDGSRRTVMIQGDIPQTMWLLDERPHLERELPKPWGFPPETRIYVLGAIATAESNPALAETALHRAMEKGYKHTAVSSGIGMRIALGQNRPGDALDYARHVISQCGSVESVPIPYRIDIIRAAMAMGGVGLLREIATSWAGGEKVVIMDEGNLGKQESAGAFAREWDASRRPSERLAEFQLTERTKKLRHVPSAPNHECIFKFSYKTGFHREEIEVGKWRRQYARIPGGLKNCVWEMEFDSRANRFHLDDNGRAWGSMLSLQLMDPGASREDDIALATLSLFHRPESFAVRSAGIGISSNTRFQSSWGNESDISPVLARLIRIDDEVEIQVNGNTLLWMPCDQNADDLAISFINSGVICDIRRMQLWEIKAKAKGK